MSKPPETLLEDIFRAGLAAVAPDTAVRAHLSLEGDRLNVGGEVYDLREFDRVLVLGAGKGAAPMAKAVEGVLGERIAEGLVCVKYGHGEPLERIELVEAAHPVPDEAGARAAERMLEIADKAGERDLVIFLLTGGASSLLTCPSQGLDLKHLQTTTNVLLDCGAAIAEVNALRKHLARVGGGQLARAAHPAGVAALMVSDVIGDDMSVIGSGPTVPDPATFADCLEVVAKYAIEDKLPGPVMERLRQGAEGRLPDTPKPGSMVFSRVRNLIVAGIRQALAAASAKARDLGYAPALLSAALHGEAREAARFLAAVAREAQATGNPVRPPVCFLAGGETTVTIHGRGKGGRNQELALSLLMELEGVKGVSGLAAGTDGSDGPTDAAGAFALPGAAARARKAGLDPGAFLRNNDSYTFFLKAGGLLVTGPTRTNVMDMTLVLVDRPSGT